jgi:hypothetical protein
VPLRTLIALVLLGTIAHAQKPQVPSPQQLSPKAAYDDAMHPLEVTRHAISNWSETEVDALKIAMARATVDCKARDPKTFSGDALVDLARLCALGLEWNAVIESTTLYIAADTPSKPLLNQAYAAQIDAELHLRDEPDAFTGSQAMLRVVPYDPLVAEVIDEAIVYMQFMHTADALTLDAARQRLLLAQIRASQTPVAGPAPTLPPQSIHDLYAIGLSFAALQQLGNQPAAARVTVAELDAALPPNLTPDDAIPIAAARKRYAFLGQPLPAFPMLAALGLPNRLPQLPATNAITALLFFPDWCAECVRMGSKFPETVFKVSGHEAYFYALLAETMPKPEPPGDGTSPKPTARDLLKQTPTVVIPATVLDQFAADDFPFLLIADAHGIIRVLQPVGEDVLEPRGTLDSAVALIGNTWALNPPKPAVSPTSATSAP